MAPEHATARWLQRVARALQLRGRKHSLTDYSQQLCSAKCPSLTLALANSAPRRQGRGARAPHLYLYTPVDLPCYIPLRAFCARKPMLRHALVPRVSASLHRLALTYNHKPVVDPLLLQNLPPWPFRPLHDSLRQQWRCCRQPYRLLLPDCRRLLDGRSSPHSQRRLLNSSPTHPHRAGAQGFRRHRFLASFLALDSPAGYRLVFSLLCSNKNILRALVRCTPSPTIQILFVSELLHGVSLYLHTG